MLRLIASRHDDDDDDDDDELLGLEPVSSVGMMGRLRWF